MRLFLDHKPAFNDGENALKHTDIYHRHSLYLDDKHVMYEKNIYNKQTKFHKIAK